MRTVSVGGINCNNRELRTAAIISDYDNVFDLWGKCSCDKTMNTQKLYDAWSNPFRDCSVSECKRQSRERLRALIQACRLCARRASEIRM